MHYVYVSVLTDNKHWLAVLGLGAGAATFITEEAFREYHNLWIAHGRPMVPKYEMGSRVPDSFGHIDRTVPSCKKRKRTSTNSNTPIKRKQQSLQQRFPRLAIDWSQVLPDRVDLQRSSSRIRPAQTDITEQFGGLLLAVVQRLLNFRNPWSWKANSCHLDCFLMVELAFFHQLASIPNMLVDGLVRSSLPLQRLFKVLLAVGTPEQDNLRDAYWAMEISTYKRRPDFGKIADYDLHREHLHAAHVKTGGVPLNTVETTSRVTCSVADHPGGPGTRTRRYSTIEAQSIWFSLPDDLSASQADIDGKPQWTTAKARKHSHTGAEDVLCTLLARSDVCQAPCKTCPRGTVTTEKLLEGVLMPATLSFGVFQASNIPIRPHFNFGGIAYGLIGVVFGNEKHFACNIKLGDYWYHYDGLGMPERAPTVKGGPWPVTPRLCRVRKDEEDNPRYLDTPDGKGSASKYTPVTIRYARLQTDTINQVPLSTPGTVDAKRQFDGFSQLWEENGGGEEPADRRGEMVEIGPVDRREEGAQRCEDRGTGEDAGNDEDGNNGSPCDGGVDGEWIGFTGLFANDDQDSDEEDLKATPEAAVVMAAKRFSNRLRKCRRTTN